MTKENFLNKWAYVYNVNDTTNPYFIADLEAVIAHEIEKAKDEPQPALNPIEQAYERGEKIRQKNWLKNAWIQKLSKTESTSDTLTTFSNNWDFITHPENWELYTEPKQVAEPTEQPKPFDKERFEAMFRAVVASGVQQNFECFKIDTTYFLQQLDAYYATKEGGNND